MRTSPKFILFFFDDASQSLFFCILEELPVCHPTACANSLNGTSNGVKMAGGPRQCTFLSPILFLFTMMNNYCLLNGFFLQ